MLLLTVPPSCFHVPVQCHNLVTLLKSQWICIQSSTQTQPLVEPMLGIETLLSFEFVCDCNYAKEVINLINSICKQQRKDVSLFPSFLLSISLLLSLSFSLSLRSISISLALLLFPPWQTLTQGSLVSVMSIWIWVKRLKSLNKQWMAEESSWMALMSRLWQYDPDLVSRLTKLSTKKTKCKLAITIINNNAH